MSPKQNSMLIGGLVVGVLSTSYLGLINLLCCAGVILGAMTAVCHYTDTQQITIESGDGAVLGVGAAVVGTIISQILTYTIIRPLGLGLEGGMMNFMSQYMSPEQMEQMQTQAAQSETLGSILIGLVIGLVVSAIFGAIGGAIGAAVFQKGDADESTAPASAESDDF